MTSSIRYERADRIQRLAVDLGASAGVLIAASVRTSALARMGAHDARRRRADGKLISRAAVSYVYAVTQKTTYPPPPSRSWPELSPAEQAWWIERERESERQGQKQ